MTLRAFLSIFFGLVVILVAVTVLPVSRAAGLIYRVSVGSGGEEGDNASSFAALSSDGRFITFQSAASNLVLSDTNATTDIFVHDRARGSTSRASVSSQGDQGNGNSSSPSISADGDLVVFDSTSTNFVVSDTNETNDVFVHRQSSGETFLVSSSALTDAPANGLSTGPVISADGSVIAFTSYASDLIKSDSNGVPDVFVRSLLEPRVQRISVSSEGMEGDGYSTSPALSADGTVVAFMSTATNLIPSDTNGLADIFVHNRATGATVRVSVSSGGEEANGASQFPSVSADGNLITFVSYATNLVPEDTNTFCDIDYDGTFDENCPDVFVYHRDTGAIERANTSALGEQANGDTISAAISPDGTYIAFQSIASNMVEGDTNTHYDIFLKDLVSGEVTLASTADSGQQSDSDSGSPAIAFQGQTVAFVSGATNLVGNDLNMSLDVFAYDREIAPTATPTPTATPLPPDAANTLYLPTILWRSQCIVEEQEPNNGFSTANNIGACQGQSIHGAFLESAPEDTQDVYHLTVSSPGTIVVTLSSIPVGNNYELALYGDNRQLLADSRLGGNSAERIAFPLQPGVHTYYVQVYRLTGYSDDGYELLWVIN